MVRKSVFKYRCIFIWCCLCCVSIVKAQVRDLESPYYIYPRQAEQHIDLSQNWELSSEEIPVENLAKLKENNWFSVAYPTSVQMANYKAGILGDPYKHLNAREHEKLEQKVWYYKKHFVIPQKRKGYSCILNFDGIDYFVDSISPGYKNSKGANSYVFALYQAQNYIDDGSSVPDRVIKISNKRDNNNSVSEGNKRFYREIEALIECKKRHIHNVVTIASFGQLSCKVKKEGGKGPTYLFPFYTMDYASGDLKIYLENNDIPFGNRIDLCLQIANGLKELKDIGYYHRDLKPDNILMFDDTWKIGDLGLIAFRDKDNIYDKKNDFIGPKGWLSPEAMNKYLQSDNNKYKFDCNIDHQSDVFQLGKVFWYILQGNAPIGNIRRSDFFDGHDDIYSVLKYMLNHSKKKRPISIDYVINELSRIMQKYKFVC